MHIEIGDMEGDLEVSRFDHECGHYGIEVALHNSVTHTYFLLTPSEAAQLGAALLELAADGAVAALDDD